MTAPSSIAGGVVLDPFMGSGSTGIAAHAEGRQFIGVERDAGYHAGALARFHEAADPAQSCLFAERAA